MRKNTNGARRIAAMSVVFALLFSAQSYVGNRSEVFAAPSELKNWTLTESADTPLAEKLVTMSSAQSTVLSVTDGKVDTVALDTRKGLKLVSKDSGAAAEGKGFRFADTQNGTFEADFRIVSAHTSTGNIGSTTDDCGVANADVKDIDDAAKILNAYADVLKATFTFTDAATSTQINLHLIAGSQYQTAAVAAYVTAGAMTDFRSVSYDDAGAPAGLSVAKDNHNSEGRYYYPARMIKTSFSNAYSYWNTCGNDEVLTSVIGFDPATMQLYGYARTGWNNAAYVKKVILDLDDPAMMGGWETGFTDVFKGDYNVSFKLDKMNANDRKADVNGETIAWNRFATMMLYTVNGVAATAATVADIPAVLSLEKKEDTAELGDEYVLPVPTVTHEGQSLAFADGGSVAVTDADGAVTIKDGKINLTKAGDYTVTYSYSSDAATAADITFKITVSDTTAPTISLKTDLVNEYEWSSALKVTFSKDDVVASDNSGSVTVTTQVFDSENKPLTVTELNAIGSYKIVYTATDATEHTATAERIILISDNTDPVIAAFEFASKATAGDEITLPEVKATDNAGGNVSIVLQVKLDGKVVAISGNKLVVSAGKYVLVWTATDASGNTATATKELTVTAAQSSSSSVNSSEQVDCNGMLDFGWLAPLAAIGLAFVLKKRARG